MARFRKDLLYPGAYRLADGRTVRYTPEKVDHLARRARDMLAAGLNIPVCWDHQPAAPLTEDEKRAQKVKNCLGFVEAAGRTEDGFLETEFEVPDPEDARRLPAVRYVSPQIMEDFVDGDGRLWPGESITHVAVTPRPVRHRQRPFVPVAMSLDANRGKRVVNLSLGDYTMADELDVEDKVEESNADPDFKSLVEALRGKGMNIPDEVHDLKTLVIAIKAGGEPDGDEHHEEEPSDDLDATLEGGAGGPSAGPEQPVMMSLDAVKARDSKLLDHERKEVERRINRLLNSGRIDKTLHGEMLAELKKVNLSLDAQGALRPHRLTAQVQAYERLKAGKFAGGKRSANLSLDASDLREAPPPGGSRPETEEEVARAVSAWDEMFPNRGK